MDASGALTTPTPEALLRRLEWRVVRRLDGRVQGDYRSVFRGEGLDVHDLREYEPGDDLRHIEWNVTARLDTPYVRQFIEDRAITTWLLLDLSASMDFGPVGRHKHLVVAEIATTLAQVLTRGGSRVGAILYDTEVTAVIPPGGGRRQVLRIAKAVLDARERASAPAAVPARSRWWRRRLGRVERVEPDVGHVTDLGGLFTVAARTARVRSLVVVVSDFVSTDGWEGPLGRLARRHDVVALRVTDPREAELPGVGTIYVEDAETGEQILVDTEAPGFRERLRDEAARRHADIMAGARAAGVDLHTVSTDDDLVRALLRIGSRRRLRR